MAETKVVHYNTGNAGGFPPPYEGRQSVRGMVGAFSVDTNPPLTPPFIREGNSSGHYRNFCCGALVAILISLVVCLSGCQKPEKPVDRISIAVPYDLESLDPHTRNALSDFSILAHFYEPLVTTDASMSLRPLLAESWENPDLSTWILHLRSGVRFHDGKVLTSDDVVYTFQRLLNGTELEMSGYLLNIASVRSLDPLTVEIRTSQPMSILLNKIRFVPIIPRGSTEEVLKTKPNGTGPYRLVEWKKEVSIRMLRNEDYWGRKPALQSVTFFFNQTPEDAIRSLLSDRCQFAQCATKKLHGLEPKFQILRNNSLFLKYISYDLLRDRTPFCNVIPNPFKNKLVREAIHLGIDRNRLVSNLSTFAVPASQAVPPFIYGFNPQIAIPASDRTRARSLLSQAGLPEGFRVTLHARQMFREAAEDIRDQLAEIGIQLDLRVLPDSELFAQLDRRESTLFLSRFGCPTGDASDIMDNSLHSVDLARHYGRHNYGDYSNPEMDHAIEESSQIQNPEERRNALQHIMSIFMDDLVWIPLYIDQDAYVVDKNFLWKPRNDSFILAWEIGRK
jgi:peptide/nickel transport system substrate-binding protein